MRFTRLFSILSLSAVLLMTILSGCGGTAAAPSSSPSAAPSQSPALSEPAAPVWTQQVYDQEFTADDGTPVMSVRYVFPDLEQAEQRPAWAAVRAYYESEGLAYLENARELAGYAADDYAVSQAMGTEFLPFSEESSFRFSYQTDELVSVVRSYYANSVTGAAHPANFQFSEQFDLLTGKRLALSDVFSDQDAARGRILDYVSQNLLSNEAPYSRELLEQEFNDDYFFLNQETFVVYYQPDTIAPHAAGIIQFAVPYTQLEDLMTLEF